MQRNASLQKLLHKFPIAIILLVKRCGEHDDNAADRDGARGDILT